MVECQVCKKLFKRITRTHLAQHGLTTEQYKEKFPGFETISAELKHAYGKKAREDNPMNDPKARKKVSKKLTGRSFSEETLERMSESAKARPTRGPHTLTTKKKIGKSNKKTAAKKKAAGYVHLPRSEEGNKKVSVKMIGNTNGLTGHKNKGMTLNLTPAQHANRSAKRVEYLASNKSIKSGTKPELAFIDYLNEQDIEFIHQYPIHTDNGSWLMDFYLPTLNLFVEIDGEFWHSTLQQINRDKIKNKIAKELNIPVVRISTNDMIFEHIYQDKDSIWALNYATINKREKLNES